MRLFLGDGHVLNAARDDEKLTFFQMNVTIAQAQLQTPFDYEEKLVLIIVVMPNKLSFNLYQLYVGIVHFAGDFRFPVFGENSEHAHFVHNRPFKEKRLPVGAPEAFCFLTL